MGKFTYLTMDEALALPRHELLDRILAQEEHYAGTRRKTAADHDAMRALGAILIRCLNINAALGALRAELHGQRDGYWESRPADDLPPGAPDS